MSYPAPALWPPRLELTLETQTNLLLILVNPIPAFNPSGVAQEIARLDKEGREKRAELTKMVEKAEGMSKGVNSSLDQLADHMLAAPR